jgi:hypothetical protein
MIIKYEITGAGWATALIGEEGRLINVTVSYLHDSLMADAAIKLKNGAPSTTKIFIDEPDVGFIGMCVICGRGTCFLNMCVI